MHKGARVFCLTYSYQLSHSAIFNAVAKYVYQLNSINIQDASLCMADYAVLHTQAPSH